MLLKSFASTLPLYPAFLTRLSTATYDEREKREQAKVRWEGGEVIFFVMLEKRAQSRQRGAP